VDHLERDGLREQIDRLGWRRFESHHLTCLEALAGAHELPVHADLAGLDAALDLRTGEPGTTSSQELVEPRAVVGFAYSNLGQPVTRSWT
jgi:hypothetical protein